MTVSYCGVEYSVWQRLGYGEARRPSLSSAHSLSLTIVTEDLHATSSAAHMGAIVCTHVTMTAKMPLGSSAHFCIIGTENATVLPVPVLDPPIQSFPLRISGIQEA